MDADTTLPLLLGMALVLPLLSFAVICVSYSLAQFAQRPISVGASKIGAYIACGAISIGFVCSLVALAIWLGELDNGKDRGYVLNGFLGSQEFIKLCQEYGIKPS